MGGAITAVAATTMVGTAGTTMVGGIIAIGGDFISSQTETGRERLQQLAASFYTASRFMSFGAMSGLGP